MTDPTAQITPASDPVADAIAALTIAARADGADFAEIAARVLTAVAANVGGVETMLAGRPGSWEADLVRQLVYGTAGEDTDDLLRHRTEPLRIALDVDGVFSDFGLYGLYEQDNEALVSRDSAASLALYDGLATGEEQTRIREIQTQLGNWTSFDDPAARAGAEALMGEAKTIEEAIQQRAAGGPLAAEAAAAASALEAVETLFEQDQAAYREAYAATIRQILADLGITVDVEVTEPTIDTFKWDPFTDSLEERARANTPLPMTGAAPDWSDGTPADALRRAGLTYTARAAAIGS